MSLLTELFGETILSASLAELKDKIKKLPPTQQERHTYLLHDWAAITGVKLSPKDFEDVT